MVCSRGRKSLCICGPVCVGIDEDVCLCVFPRPCIRMCVNTCLFVFVRTCYCHEPTRLYVSEHMCV